MLISIVVPVFNEGVNVGNNLKQILAVAATSGYDTELVVVDDGSTDGTDIVLRRFASEDARLAPLYFTRNFGKEAAIHAGLSAAKGDAVIVIDADLQHPPELIPRMLQLWSQGVPVVGAVKRQRGEESRLSKWYAVTFYRLFKIFAGIDIEGQSDFKLLDRAVVNSLLAFSEKQKFFRGLVDWSGYECALIPFEVAAREGSSSRWSFLRLARYAVNNITSFSSAPLKIVTLLGLLTLLVGVTFGAISLYQKLDGVALDGFTTVNMLIIFSSGAMMVSLGIIGYYLSRIYDELKSRPLYLLKPALKPALKPELKLPNETKPADSRIDTV